MSSGKSCPVRSAGAWADGAVCGGGAPIKCPRTREKNQGKFGVVEERKGKEREGGAVREEMGGGGRGMRATLFVKILGPVSFRPPPVLSSVGKRIVLPWPHN